MLAATRGFAEIIYLFLIIAFVGVHSQSGSFSFSAANKAKLNISSQLPGLGKEVIR
ncbi:MAG: hypothetical protein KKB51_05130 [Candidatus Riflebacteria bacterium]|nr:hypothetical protein [Candidatus Riflebacteria bacterium]